MEQARLRAEERSAPALIPTQEPISHQHSLTWRYTTHHPHHQSQPHPGSVSAAQHREQQEQHERVMAAEAEEHIPFRWNHSQLKSLLQTIHPPLPPPAHPSGLGNPGPTGMAAFAITTFFLSCFNTGVLIDRRLEDAVLPTALFVGGVAQFAAGIVQFRTNNTFGSTAFVLYGAFWMSYAAYGYLILPNLKSQGLQHGHATGLFLLAWTLVTCYMTVAAVRVSVAVLVVFLLVLLQLLLLTIGALGPSEGCVRAGGWVGLITALAAAYTSAAVLINTTWGRHVLHIGEMQDAPLGRAGKEAAEHHEEHVRLWKLASVPVAIPVADSEATDVPQGLPLVH